MGTVFVDVGTSLDGFIVRQCLGGGVVDELHVHVAPVLLGAGVRLFDESVADVKLEAGPVTAAPRWRSSPRSARTPA